MFREANMKYHNSIQIEASGRYALFTDPLTRAGGEKCTLPVPTYEALKGIVSAIYWQPQINWIIDRVRILEPIRTESRSVLRRKYNKRGYDMSIYTYLTNVRYHIQAHFVPSDTCGSFTESDEHKHYRMALRMLERGGRRNIYLGTADCPCSVNACEFESGNGFYDDSCEDIGLMFHSFTYSGDTPDSAAYFRCCMENGVIRFPLPQECTLIQKLNTEGVLTDALV